MLAEFAGQHDGGEAPLHQRLMQAAGRVAGGAENQRAGGLIPAQNVDQRGLGLVPGHSNSSVFDVVVRLRTVDGVDTQGVTLVFTRQSGDVVRDGG